MTGYPEDDTMNPDTEGLSGSINNLLQVWTTRQCKSSYKQE